MSVYWIYLNTWMYVKIKFKNECKSILKINRFNHQYFDILVYYMEIIYIWFKFLNNIPLQLTWLKELNWYLMRNLQFIVLCIVFILLIALMIGKYIGKIHMNLYLKYSHYHRTKQIKFFKNNFKGKLSFAKLVDPYYDSQTSVLLNRQTTTDVTHIVFHRLNRWKTVHEWKSEYFY